MLVENACETYLEAKARRVRANTLEGYEQPTAGSWLRRCWRLLHWLCPRRSQPAAPRLA